jgi:hypothetical protein
MKFADIKNFCSAQNIDAKFIKIGCSYLLAVPAAASPEVINFLDRGGVQHSQPCEIIKNIHDIYLSLSG